ncbi:MAG TPA: hypothetical protein VF210_02220 [Pseudomonadales bacterium]
MCDFWRQAHGPRPDWLDDEDFFRFRTASAGRFDVLISTINKSGSDTRANLDAEIELWRKLPGGTWAPTTAFTRLAPADDLSVGIRVTEGSAVGADYAAGTCFASPAGRPPAGSCSSSPGTSRFGGTRSRVSPGSKAAERQVSTSSSTSRANASSERPSSSCTT